MAKMVRKQIYIESDQETKLKKLAKELDISEAALIRRALDRALESIGNGFQKRGYLLNPKAWQEAKAFIQKLIDQGPVPGSRRWTREELYEERPKAYARKC